MVFKADQKKCAPVRRLILAHGAFPGNAELTGLRLRYDAAQTGCISDPKTLAPEGLFKGGTSRLIGY